MQAVGNAVDFIQCRSSEPNDFIKLQMVQQPIALRYQFIFMTMQLGD
jgi:hypothetical protein